MNDYEERRLANIKRNQALINELGIARQRPSKGAATAATSSTRQKRKTFATPSRASARIAATPKPPIYNDDEIGGAATDSGASKRRRVTSTPTAVVPDSPSSPPAAPKRDLASLETNWYDWPVAAEAPTRSADGTFHFASHPRFQPNKSPLEILREGAFGGSYYRPVRNRSLGTTIADDYQRLPPEWLSALDVPRQLTAGSYDPETNKFGVKCGQSIEEWEAAGWINADWDVRGWFQWYERFFRGRRGDDDERQVGRWDRCVGERGRWRRSLVKAYLKKGVRDVADEGLEEDGQEVSPILHQTCHHWAWEIRQDYLDRMWREGL